MRFFAKIPLVCHLFVSIGFAQLGGDSTPTTTKETTNVNQKRTYTIEQLRGLLTKGEAILAYYDAVIRYIQTPAGDSDEAENKQAVQKGIENLEELGVSAGDEFAIAKIKSEGEDKAVYRDLESDIDGLRAEYQTAKEKQDAGLKKMRAFFAKYYQGTDADRLENQVRTEGDFFDKEIKRLAELKKELEGYVEAFEVAEKNEATNTKQLHFLLESGKDFSNALKAERTACRYAQGWDGKEKQAEDVDRNLRQEYCPVLNDFLKGATGDRYLTDATLKSFSEFLEQKIDLLKQAETDLQELNIADDSQGDEQNPDGVFLLNRIFAKILSFPTALAQATGCTGYTGVLCSPWNSNGLALVQAGRQGAQGFVANVADRLQSLQYDAAIKQSLENMAQLELSSYGFSADSVFSLPGREGRGFTMQGLGNAIVSVLVGIAGTVGTGALIWSGCTLLFGAGTFDEEAASKAKKMMLINILALAVIFLSSIIVRSVIFSVDQVV